jgi:type IV secretory pathway VirB2 component (pilin)
MRLTTRLPACAAALVAALLAAPASAWGDSEPLQPLSASTTDLVALAIAVAALVVVCWLVLGRLVRARRAQQRANAGDADS